MNHGSYVGGEGESAPTGNSHCRSLETRTVCSFLAPDMGFLKGISLALLFHLCRATPPQIRVHNGYISVHDGLYNAGLSQTATYSVGQPYTFELYMEGGDRQDYMIDSCTMNGQPFIGSYGCVQCGTYVMQSVETEQYNTPGAIKRTLVHFTAPATSIQFVCQVKVLDCCACAERSCERRPALFGITVHPIPVLCGIATGAALGGGYAQVTRDVYPVAVGRDYGAGIPWWLWLLLALLLLLLLLCCIACCLAAFARRRKQQKTVTTRVATVEENKAVGIGVGTENPSVLEKGVGTNGSLYKESHIMETRKERIVPAIVTDDSYHNSRDEDFREESFDAQYTRIGAGGGRDRDREERREMETFGRDRNTGSYSVREGRILNERFTRNGRPLADSPEHLDRSSYRNYAYERDMGRVAPMSGFDEVETTERRYCLSDDESEIIEKDVKRTHTTRFVQETRTINEGNESRDRDSRNSVERYREEGEQHAVYAQNIAV